MFTAKHQETSEFLQKYASERHGLEIVRCCVPNYKIKGFSSKMDVDCRSGWEALPDSADFAPSDTVYTICHNCSAILEETKP